MKETTCLSAILRLEFVTFVAPSSSLLQHVFLHSDYISVVHSLAATPPCALSDKHTDIS